MIHVIEKPNRHVYFKDKGDKQALYDKNIKKIEDRTKSHIEKESVTSIEYPNSVFIKYCIFIFG